MATVPTTPRTSTYTLAASNPGPFLVGFRLFDDDGLEVFVNGLPRTDWTLSANYLNGYDDNASITFTADLAAGSVIQIDGALNPGRDEDFVNGAGLVAKVNIELARHAAALSELHAIARRTLRGMTEQDPVDGLTASDLIGLSDAIASAQASASAAAGSATAASGSATAAAGSASAAAASAALLGAWRGAWVTATAYAAGDRVENAGSTYYATVAHTSAALFSTDLSALRWGLVAAKGAAGAGTGDVLAANNGSDFVNKPSTLANLGGQPLDATLTALAGLNTTAGLVVQTGTDTFTKRTLQAGSGIAITNPAGTAGDPSISVTGVTVAQLAAAAVIDATDTLALNKSDTALPTAKAVSDYVDAVVGVAPYYLAITASTTWNKPAGYSADTMVEVELWGGGGGGGRGSQGGAGGGGGSYKRLRFRYGDLPSSVAVTIGAGGAGRPSSNGVGTAGGSTSFGFYATALGGAGGLKTDDGNPVSGALGGSSGAGAIWDGGDGGVGDDSAATAGQNATYGGGGGGGGGSPGGRAGGFSTVVGGKGGDGTDQGVAASNGTAPGGGGGGSEDTASGDGARGEVRIWIVA